MPPASWRHEQEADGGIHWGAGITLAKITTHYKKFDTKNTTSTISETSFTLPADGWFHIENKGVHPNEKAGVVPVLDGKASGASSIVRRGRAARQRFGDGGFPEFVLANTGANVYNYFQP